jgi:hypothetical protein
MVEMIILMQVNYSTEVPHIYIYLQRRRSSGEAEPHLEEFPSQPPKKSTFPIPPYTTIINATTIISPLISLFLTPPSFANMPAKKNNYAEFEGEPEEVAYMVRLEIAHNAWIEADGALLIRQSAREHGREGSYDGSVS